MSPYLSLAEAADRLLVSPAWFLANVAIDLPRPIVLNGETSWLAADVDDWKARRDAAREGALDELAALDQGALASRLKAACADISVNEIVTTLHESGETAYFRYDFAEVPENDSEDWREVNEAFDSHGIEIIESHLEHDCYSGEVRREHTRR